MTVESIIRLVAIFVILGYSIWIRRSIGDLKNITEGFRNVSDSIKSISEFMKKIHSSAREMYNLEHVEEIVDVREELLKSRFNKQAEEMKAKYEAISRSQVEGRITSEQALKNLQDAYQQKMREIGYVTAIYTALSVFTLSDLQIINIRAHMQKMEIANYYENFDKYMHNIIKLKTEYGDKVKLKDLTEDNSAAQNTDT